MGIPLRASPDEGIMSTPPDRVRLRSGAGIARERGVNARMI